VNNIIGANQVRVRVGFCDGLKDCLEIVSVVEFEEAFDAFDRSITIMPNAKAPDIKRTTVKLAGSIVFSPSANRQSTELAAKAHNAVMVSKGGSSLDCGIG
jgi:hypothetical protein